MSEVTLLTITGDRQEMFALCEMYMQRQTIFEDCKWLVVDDGQEETTCTQGQTKIKLPPAPDPRTSFRRNMLVGLAAITTPIVVIIEDDDHYHPWHIETHATILRWKSLSGTSRAKYYNVRERCWRVHPNNEHSSLCSTAFKGDRIKRLMMDYLDNSPHPERLDGHTWRRAGVKPEEKSIIPCSSVIGIKGGSGRGGLGIHHRTDELTDYTPDPEMVKLRKWIGQDADLYAKFYVPSESPPEGI